ncbi:hypothetical protein [Mycoplasma tauri]|uniref:hypothetical protein n=1 Tax=Mycoplasma tauri TaxID=547987 RepID=UPI001CBD3DAA|nr:hypothetical protein [Mycoplasma tauri]MBZ4203403.1 hypothetical protein [Mycoplasma tauri]
MLLWDFSKPVFSNFLKPRKEQDTFWTKIKSFTRFILETITNIAIGIVSNMIAPGAGLFLEHGLSLVSDLFYNWAFNDFKVDWKEFGISASFNTIPFISKSLRLVNNMRRGNRVLNLVDNLNITDDALKNKIKSQAKNLTNIYKHAGGVDTYAYKVWEEQSKELLLYLNKQNIFMHTAEQSLKKYNEFNKNFNKFKNAFIKLRAYTSLLTSPRYAGKKLIDTVTKKPKSKINKFFNNLISEKQKAVAKKLGIKTQENALKSIPLNSKWLSSLKIMRANNPWDIKRVNALLRFQPKATNNKKPVLLVNKTYDDVIKLVQAKSPGQYYLKNMAWGWEIGGILRKQANWITKSTIPIYSSFLSTLLFSGKTIQYIIKNIQAKEFLLFNSDKAISEFYKGVKDNALKGIEIKYVKPVTSTIRSVMTGEPRYAIFSGLRVGKKAYFNNKMKNIYNKARKGNKGSGKIKKIKF